MKIIDTDILIDLSYDIDQALNVVASLRASKETIAISVISQMEFLIGCPNRDELEAGKEFLRGLFEILPLNAKISAVSSFAP